MKAIKWIILILIVCNLFLSVGCKSMDSAKPEQKAGDENKQIESEDTGISDVFEDTEEVTPPQIPS